MSTKAPTRADLARELLRYKMEEYSQDGFCASWLDDLEFELWQAADEREPDERRAETVEVSRECRILAEIAGGWWAWNPDESAGNDLVFLPMDRWLEILEQRESSD